jgi:3-deoxy-D-manno-octulosonate 8-phosphate phosphatase (KDO 8-P phosphatase)
MSAERAKKIKVILFDVDGVLTDGTIFLFPAPSGAGVAPEQASAGEAMSDAKQRLTDSGSGFATSSRNVIEMKGFHAHDGTAIGLARLGGLQTGIITKRLSETVALRARDLRLTYVYQGVADKLNALDEICAAAGVTREQVAFVGDDLIDVSVMRACGLAIAVPNARPDIRELAHYITESRGGHGAARDAVEYILRAQGSLERARMEYLAERSPTSK